jgi:hypothetical protein
MDGRQNNLVLRGKKGKKDLRLYSQCSEENISYFERTSTAKG